MTSTFALVLLLGGMAVCVATGVFGGYSERANHQANPEFLNLAHYATSTWSAQQPGKTHFDTVAEVVKVETQVVAGTNYRLTLKVAESTCELTSTYNKDTCLPKADAAHRTCTTVVFENLQGDKSVSSFECEAA